MSKTQTAPEPELVDLAGLRVLMGGRSRQWIYDQLRRDPAFPRPLKLNAFTNAWRLREIRDYLDALPRLELSGLSGPDQRRAAAQGGAA